MKSRYIIFIALFILVIVVSGCTSNNSFGNKGPVDTEARNYAFNAVRDAWNITGYNISINNSSFKLLSSVYISNDTEITTIQFNTTDGVTHMSNVSNYNYTNPIVLDIDNKSITRSSKQ
jgi:hypothetical protein